MTNKSYIRGRRNKACCALMDKLNKAGIRASVGHTERGNVLYVYTMREADVSRVPKTFDGWDVISKHYTEHPASPTLEPL